MNPQIVSFRVGDATVTKIPELLIDGSDPSVLFRDRPDAIALARRNASVWGGNAIDPDTGFLQQSVHAWLVRTPGRIVLVDSATGNGKLRPDMPIFDRLEGPFLERLALAGVQPDEIDLVLHTHMHADHVGWNTRWTGGHWAPVFRARHVFSGLERAYYASLAAGDGAAHRLRAQAALGV